MESILASVISSQLYQSTTTFHSHHPSTFHLPPSVFTRLPTEDRYPSLRSHNVLAMRLMAFPVLYLARAALLNAVLLKQLSAMDLGLSG